MPSIIVITNPPGSFPGMIALAINPAISPNITHPIIANIFAPFALKTGDKILCTNTTRDLRQRELTQKTNHYLVLTLLPYRTVVEYVWRRSKLSAFLFPLVRLGWHLWRTGHGAGDGIKPLLLNVSHVTRDPWLFRGLKFSVEGLHRIG